MQSTCEISIFSQFYHDTRKKGRQSYRAKRVGFLLDVRSMPQSPCENQVASRIWPLCLQYLTLHILSHWRQCRDRVSVSYLISQKTAFLLGWPANSECSIEVVPAAVIFLLVLVISAWAQFWVPANLPGSPPCFANTTGHKSSVLKHCSQQSLIRLLSGPVTWKHNPSAPMQKSYGTCISFGSARKFNCPPYFIIWNSSIWQAYCEVFYSVRSLQSLSKVSLKCSQNPGEVSVFKTHTKSFLLGCNKKENGWEEGKINSVMR